MADELLDKISSLDAAKDYQGILDLILGTEGPMDQLIYLVYQTLTSTRFATAHVVAKALMAKGVRNPVVAFALSLGGLMANTATDEAVGREVLRTSVDPLSEEQRQQIYSAIISKTVPNLVNHYFVNNNLGMLARLVEILKAGVPSLRNVFTRPDQIPELDVDAMKRAAQQRAKLIDFSGPRPGTPKVARKAVVAVRDYFLGAADRATSRLCDLGPRITETLNTYGWQAQFFGMQFLNAHEDYRGIIDVCRQTTADVLILDDNIIQNVHVRVVRNAMIAHLRQEMPALKIVSVYFDPWMLTTQDLIDSSANVDIVWAPFPSLPAWQHPSLAGRVYYAQFPLGLKFEPPRIELQPRLTFAGGVMGYNWHRAVWLGAATQAGLPIQRQISSHKPDGLPALESYEAYLRRLAGATCSLNFSMREDMQRVITGRTFETILSGALLVEEWSPDIDYYFTAGEHYLSFSTFAELEAASRFVTERPSEAEAIRANGTKFAWDRYNDTRLMAALDRMLYYPDHQVQSFKALSGAEVVVKVVDVGANPIGGPAPYESLLHAGEALVVGFEPNPHALAELEKIKGPNETYLPFAIGNGQRQILNFCMAPGMTSLLKPNPEVLNLFHGFPDWGRVTATVPIDTMRLDDIPETKGVDFLKMDIQGGELMVLQHAEDRVRDALVIQTEVEFLQMYVDQPLFSDIDQFLRARGFVFHRFYPEVSRVIRPMVVANSIYSGLSQLLWADAIFVRDFTRLDTLSDRQLLAMAAIVHTCCGSLDLAFYLLTEHDRRNGTDYANSYFRNLGRHGIKGSLTIPGG